MVSGNELRPIIKRKKVVIEAGHHGGAWKVAYADFVTAMMAFFLLMWLINATTATQRRGLADYFSPTIPLAQVSGGGTGAMFGDSPFANQEMPQDGTGATQQYSQDARQARGETGVDPSELKVTEDQFKLIEEALYGRGGESLVADETLKHIVTQVTDRGYVIDIHDLPGRPIFKAGSTEPMPVLQHVVALVSHAVAETENQVEVNGHLASDPIVVARSPVWALSTDRADLVRRMMVGDGVDGGRMQRITGHADRLHVHDNPMATRNNRVEIILLRDV